jgi:hypothetical protein
MHRLMSKHWLQPKSVLVRILPSVKVGPTESFVLLPANWTLADWMELVLTGEVAFAGQEVVAGM